MKIGAQRPRRFGRQALAVLLFGLVIFGAIAWRDTTDTPEIKQTEIGVRGLKQGGPPLRLLLMSDLHVAGPDMPPSRLAKIVEQANRLHPDIVLIAGDLVSDRRLASRHYSLHDAIAPLAALKPRLGTVAVLGNHDHWRNAVIAKQELEEIGVTVLANTATQIGPIVIGGLDDDFTGQADIAKTAAAMRALGGPGIVLSHSPDPFPSLPSNLQLMLAGHTHCGQIRYPWGGSPATMSRYGNRYACGRIDESGRTLIVTGGLGTSVLPFRFGARPDMWLVTVVAQPGA